jgi:hypothetical protein
MKKIPTYMSLGFMYADELCMIKTNKLKSMDKLSDNGFICDFKSVPLCSVHINLIELRLSGWYVYEITLNEIIDPVLKIKWQKD